MARPALPSARRGGFTYVPDKSRIPPVCDWASPGSEPWQQINQCLSHP